MRKALLFAVLAVVGAAPAWAARWVHFKSPGPGMHFTEGLPVVVFLDVFEDPNIANLGSIACPGGEAYTPHDSKPSFDAVPVSCASGAPIGWPQAQVLINGVPQTDAATGSTIVQGGTWVDFNGNPAPIDMYRFSIAGLSQGQHTLVGRGRFQPTGALTQDGVSPVTITVDPWPAGKTQIALTSNQTVSGLNWSNVAVRGNGYTLTVSGNVTIQDSLVTGLAIITSGGGSVGTVDIRNSIFEDTGSLDLNITGGAVIKGNEFRANNRLVFDSANPETPNALNLRGTGSAPKFFQGNKVAAGRTVISNMSNWLVGAGTDQKDDDGNIFMGPRCSLDLRLSSSAVRGNFAFHNYFGHWSQGKNFVLTGSASGPNGILVEHNLIRGGSWPVEGVAGEFRYNLVYGYGHTWLRIADNSGPRIHHNVFVPEGASGLGEGFWFLSTAATDIQVFNNTFDGGGLTGDFGGPFVRVTSPQQVASLRNNLFTFSRNANNGGPGEPLIVGASGSILFADYNAFYSPDASQTDNYAVDTESTPGFAAHDAGGVNGRLAANPFAGARVDPFDGLVNDDLVWNRNQKLSSILAAFRARYAPVSPQLIDAGDPADGAGVDIGAIGASSGVPRPEDQFGRFGTPPPLDLLPPARPRGLRKR